MWTSSAVYACVCMFMCAHVYVHTRCVYVLCVCVYYKYDLRLSFALKGTVHPNLWVALWPSLLCVCCCVTVPILCGLWMDSQRREGTPVEALKNPDDFISSNWLNVNVFFYLWIWMVFTWLLSFQFFVYCFYIVIIWLALFPRCFFVVDMRMLDLMSMVMAIATALFSSVP